MKVLEIVLDFIEVGERRRRDYGDIQKLARGIQQVGLIQPIVVDATGVEKYRLVTGERRLRAFQLLKLRSIPCVLREQLSKEQIHEIELEENENRKDLTEQERRRTFVSAKNFVANARKAAAVLSQNESKPSGPKGGRPSDPASSRAIAAALGTSQSSVIRNEQHVLIAERFGFLQGTAWRQAEVLRLEKELKRIPESEQGTLCKFMERSVVPLRLLPDKAMEYVEIMGLKTVDERLEIYRLSESLDSREQAKASKLALERPTMPDERIGYIQEVLVILRKAIRPPFDDAPEVKGLENVIALLEKMRREIQSRCAELKKEEAQVAEA